MVDELDVAELELADADGLGDAEPDAELDPVVAVDDTTDAADGAAAVPPTLAHDVSTVPAAIEASAIASP